MVATRWHIRQLTYLTTALAFVVNAPTAIPDGIQRCEVISSKIRECCLAPLLEISMPCVLKGRVYLTHIRWVFRSLDQTNYSRGGKEKKLNDGRRAGLLSIQLLINPALTAHWMLPNEKLHEQWGPVFSIDMPWDNTPPYVQKDHEDVFIRRLVLRGWHPEALWLWKYTDFSDGTAMFTSIPFRCFCAP